MQKQLLMIIKKRGQGAGKWNMPGGKLQPGESPEAAAIRECEEETGLRPAWVEKRGMLEFFFAEGSKKQSWDNLCHVFVAREFSGTLQPESEECSALWVNISEIPYEKMWEDDRKWLPLLLNVAPDSASNLNVAPDSASNGHTFHHQYFFDTEDKLIGEQRLSSA